MKLESLRNIGISAHIDSGKTTLSERILFYGGKIHKIEEVRGGGDGATMDHMELEKERGITITSAATTLFWDNHTINLIDTPGHVDFTVEVERSLRVLDGAVLVLCGVAGVQSQSITVDRQMKRYNVPALAFVNKLDRSGANPIRVANALRDKLSHNTVIMQYPIGAEADYEGAVDLITRRATYYDGAKGEIVRYGEVPANLVDEVEKYRAMMLDSISMFSDEMTELLLDEKVVPDDLIHETIKKAVHARKITPVFMGTAYRNKGVQALLDAVIRYLPSPMDRQYWGNDNEKNEKVEVFPDPKKPLCAMAFKIADENFGQLTYTRVYQGTLKKGETYYNPRMGKSQRVGRLVRMHSNDREDVDFAEAGDIIAMVGVECASGDTYCSEGINVTMEKMFVPEPVIELAIKPAKQEDLVKLSKALNRFMKEDPTFRVSVDKESNETRIAGMGELHLEIYVERMRREYKANVIVGQPKVNYREAPTQGAKFDYKHKKQTGGSGQYGHVVGELNVNDTPKSDEDSHEFLNSTVGGSIPKEYIPGVEKGYRESLDKGPLAGFKVINTRFELKDGTFHAVDSSEMAFKVAARQAFKQAFLEAKPVILEPIMRVEAETPMEFQGPVQGDLSSRRGMLLGSDIRDEYAVIIAEVPLSEMFGYSTDLRSKTQGKATFSMEFAAYRPVPSSIQEQLVKKYRDDKAKGGNKDDE
ncbi:MAG: elongation factor G [Oligoflexus sp.]|nr:elongation factor G [Oligoflexus sp.]